MTSPAEAAEAPFIDLSLTHRSLRAELLAAFERVLDSGRFSSGEEVARFEAALAGYVGAAHAVGVASGTASLHLALRAAGVGPGDEVIVPANTFFATVEAVFAVGATPVFADAELETALVSPASVEAGIGARTTAIIAVHLYGQPANMDELRRIADARGLFLLEDAAQALGARWSGRRVGTLADAAAFSFYPTKNLGALGEAGAVTTEDSSLARQVSLLRNHGESPKNVHVEVGFNERLDELQAALLTVKLQHLDEAVSDRRRLAALYRDLLAGIVGVRQLATAPGAEPAPHLLVVAVEGRDDVLRALHAAGVPAGVHYPTPVHLQPACRHLGVPAGGLPNAEALARSVLSLPLYPGMSEERVERTVTALAGAVSDR